MLFQLLKSTRAIRRTLTGNKPEPEKFFICRIKTPVDPEKLYNLFCASHISGDGWHYNNMSLTSYKGQIFQLRKVGPTWKYQWHLRFYEDGTVSGHHELNPEYLLLEHSRGVKCRPLWEAEKREIIKILKEGGLLD